MKNRILLATLPILLGACANFPIPTSESDPPPPNAPSDLSCMQDCQGDGTSAELCHQRCAK